MRRNPFAALMAAAALFGSAAEPAGAQAQGVDCATFSASDVRMAALEVLYIHRARNGSATMPNAAFDAALTALMSPCGPMLAVDAWGRTRFDRRLEGLRCYGDTVTRTCLQHDLEAEYQGGRDAGWRLPPNGRANVEAGRRWLGACARTLIAAPTGLDPDAIVVGTQ